MPRVHDGHINEGTFVLGRGAAGSALGELPLPLITRKLFDSGPECWEWCCRIGTGGGLQVDCVLTKDNFKLLLLRSHPPIPCRQRHVFQF